MTPIKFEVGPVHFILKIELLHKEIDSRLYLQYLVVHLQPLVSGL